MASLRQLVEQHAERMEPVLRGAFLAAIQDIRSEAQISVLVERLEQGDLEGAIAALNLRPEFLAGFDEALRAAYLSGGQMALTALPRLVDPFTGGRLVVRFDGRNRRAEAWLQQHSSQLVVEILEDQREGIRGVLRGRMEEGVNPRTTALDIVGRINRATGRREGGLVGLTSQQMSYVENLRRELSDPETAAHYFTRSRRDKRYDRTVAKAIREGKPLDKATIDRIAARYTDRLLSLRGETIARTESIAAFQTAQWDGIWQMVDRGQISEHQVSKVWRSAGDGRVRDSHTALNGQEKPLSEPFQSPMTGALMLHPHDRSLGAPAEETILCRCWAEPKIDFLAGFGQAT